MISEPGLFLNAVPHRFLHRSLQGCSHGSVRGQGCGGGRRHDPARGRHQLCKRRWQDMGFLHGRHRAGLQAGALHGRCW